MNARSRWISLISRVRGAKHALKEVPCEDYIGSLSIGEGTDTPLTVIAASDGHGSSKSYYSHIGSRCAVDAVIGIIRETYEQWLERSVKPAKSNEEGDSSHMISDSYSWEVSFELSFTPVKIRRTFHKDKASGRRVFSSQDTLSSIFRRELEPGSKRLVRRIVERWRHRVEEHWNVNHAPSEHALPDSKQDNADKGAKQFESQEIWQRYGATLIVAGIAPSFRFFVQIGDGDILQVGADPKLDPPYHDHEEWWIFSDDSKSVGEETYSLSMQSAWKHARTRFERDTDNAQPPFYLIATDGYRNSFSTDKGFTEAAADYRNWLLSSEGEGLHVDPEVQEIREQITIWLRSTTHDGSGDDISLGILIKDSAIGSVTSGSSANTEDESESHKGVKTDSEETTDPAEAKSGTDSGESKDKSSSVSNYENEIEEASATTPTKTKSPSHPDLSEDPSDVRRQGTPEDDRSSETDSSDPASPGPQSDVW